MPWEYFTAPLAAGDELTSEMVAELLAALDERMQAVDSGWRIETALPEEIALRASRLPTRRVYYSGPGGASNLLGTLHGLVATVSTSYLRPLFVEAGTGTGGSYGGNAVLEEALTSLGESPADLATWTGTVLSTRVYWNMLREAIRLLRWRGFSPATTDSELKFNDRGSPPVDLATAKARWSSGADTLATTPAGMAARSTLFAEPFPISPPGPPDYLLETRSSEGTITVPAHGAWLAGWEAAGLGAITQPLAPHEYAFVATGALLRLDGVDVALDSAGLGAWRQLFAGSFAGTGAVAVELLAGPELDVDVWDDLDAGALVVSGRRGAANQRTVTTLALKPGFERP